MTKKHKYTKALSLLERIQRDNEKAEYYRKAKYELKWIEDQKRSYRAGTLSSDKIKKLEAIPGWTWTPGLFKDL